MWLKINTHRMRHTGWNHYNTLCLITVISTQSWTNIIYKIISQGINFKSVLEQMEYSFTSSNIYIAIVCDTLDVVSPIVVSSHKRCIVDESISNWAHVKGRYNHLSAAEKIRPVSGTVSTWLILKVEHL